jgi:hypothetical protein
MPPLADEISEGNVKRLLSPKFPEREILLASFFELADNFPNGK